ncbi:MAG: hypothetical protein CSA65_00420 [Proteobacteria bacterium]|nr:MAG: hypothetical protein CSA65_00420 [Pseudomonadota bacterium]
MSIIFRCRARLLALTLALAGTPLGACADDSCRELALRRCECCPEAQVESCIQIVEDSPSAPSDVELARCEDDLAVFDGCQSIPSDELDAFCAASKP